MGWDGLGEFFFFLSLLYQDKNVSRISYFICGCVRFMARCNGVIVRAGCRRKGGCGIFRRSFSADLEVT